MNEIGARLMTLKEVAEYLQVAETTIRNRDYRIRNGLRTVRVGRSLRFRQEDVQDYVKRNVEGERNGID